MKLCGIWTYALIIGFMWVDWLYPHKCDFPYSQHVDDKLVQMLHSWNVYECCYSLNCVCSLIFQAQVGTFILIWTFLLIEKFRTMLLVVWHQKEWKVWLWNVLTDIGLALSKQLSTKHFVQGYVTIDCDFVTWTSAGLISGLNSAPCRRLKEAFCSQLRFMWIALMALTVLCVAIQILDVVRQSR